MPRHGAPPSAAPRTPAGRSQSRRPASLARGAEPGTAGWTAGLAAWYRRHGRHDLPWRLTRDPWAVLVSEVMLQQTSVARVLPRWHAFLERWPTPEACAADPLDELLRAWQGLGYPRRARALHLAAASVARSGWPPDEAGLRTLPGVGAYTARAMLTLAFERPTPPPRDVNLGRVAARAALGLEPHQASPAALDAILAAGRPRALPARDFTLALFDVGATLCTARAPRCATCPLVRCRSRDRLRAAPPPPQPRRQAAWATSMRRLRGAVLAAMLAASPPRNLEELSARVSAVPAAARAGAVAEALSGLVADGLLQPPGWTTAV